jgi:hypothetical protein
MNGKFLDLLPGFVSGAHQIHNLLAGVTFVLAVAGLLLIVNQAFREQSVKSVKSALVRLIVIVIMLGTLGGWGDILSSAVDDLAAQAGLSPNGGGVFEAYREAVARKFGSDSAAPAANAFESGGSNGQSTGTTGDFTVPDGAATGSNTGIKLTRYGYEQPGDPNYDSNSAQGIGAFGFDSSAGSLVPLQSAALSPDVAQQYNLVPGQQFTVTTANGQQISLVYADNTADYLSGRVDIYDPFSQLANDGAAVTSINGGPIVANNGSGTATRFFCFLVAITLWPLAWAICDLLTRALIELAVNPANNLGASVFGASAMMLGYWVLLAIWVMGSSVFAPFIVSAALVAGSSGIAGVLGATIGAAVARATGGGAGSAVLASQVAAAPISVASRSVMNAYQNFARRPLAAASGNGDGTRGA